jgi:hypothetical protein
VFNGSLAAYCLKIADLGHLQWVTVTERVSEVGFKYRVPVGNLLDVSKKFELYLSLSYNYAQTASRWMPLKDCLKGPSGQVRFA